MQKNTSKKILPVLQFLTLLRKNSAIDLGLLCALSARRVNSVIVLFKLERSEIKNHEVSESQALELLLFIACSDEIGSVVLNA